MVATDATFVSVTWASTIGPGLPQLAARTTRCFSAARARRRQYCHAHNFMTVPLLTDYRSRYDAAGYIVQVFRYAIFLRRRQCQPPSPSMPNSPGKPAPTIGPGTASSLVAGALNEESTKRSLKFAVPPTTLKLPIVRVSTVA